MASITSVSLVPHAASVRVAADAARAPGPGLPKSGLPKAGPGPGPAAGHAVPVILPAATIRPSDSIRPESHAEAAAASPGAPRVETIV